MKYRFIAVIHNMKLESIKNKGIPIFEGARISNGENVLSETTTNELFSETAGVHSISEFNDKVYWYFDDKFHDMKDKAEVDQVANQKVFYHLRQIESFITELWKVKDNNTYVRDGFILAYSDKFEDGFTYKASLSSISTYAYGHGEVSMFSDEEIRKASQSLVQYSFEDFTEESFGGKFPTATNFFKRNGSERMDRANYFTLAARYSFAVPMKIIFYCTALECLFTSGTSEISHKIAERVALMLGNTSQEKKELFSNVKKAYGLRSKLIHGSTIKGDDEAIINTSVQLDNILRKLIVQNNEIFKGNDAEMEKYFFGLLFEK